MSPDGNPLARTSSPANSGRSSPNFRIRQKDEEDLLKKDKSFRRYASGVERVLAQFAAVEEWADYISFLSRLLKALQGKPSGYTEIAHKRLVAKRLSQCLNPVLPSGVHQKTLEVYAYIFSSLGREGLAFNLNLYLPGLAPTLSFASLKIRPSILTLFESHVVKLPPAALRPALKALILSLLPCLEEENSEEFEWALRILNGLKVATAGGNDAGPSSYQYFWQCFFLASITSSSRRSGALAYLSRDLPLLALAKTADVSASFAKSQSTSLSEEELRLQDAISAVATPEPGLLIRCFCAGLQDEQLLIQRGFLDLLVTHLPLHSEVLQKKAVADDLNMLITAATSVVSRRDMSLNRRLWTWFLGPEPSVEASDALSPISPRSAGQLTPRQDVIAIQSRYFEQHGSSPLVGTIKSMILKEPQEPSERSRPLRICLSLMDRWEIGSIITPQIFLPALQSVWRYQTSNLPKEAHSEVLRSANMFFDAVESSLIWSEVAKLMAESLAYDKQSPTRSKEILDFLLFVVNNFNIREEEMQVAHMPLVCIFALVQLRKLVSEAQDSQNNVISSVLQVVTKLVELIPTRVLKVESNRYEMSPTSFSAAYKKQILTNIEIFYTRDYGNIDAKRPVSESDMGPLILTCTFELLAPILLNFNKTSITNIELTTSILATMIKRGPRIVPDMDPFVSVFRNESGDSLPEPDAKLDFAEISAKVLCLETILGSPNSSDWMPMRLVRQCVPVLVAEIWPALSPSRLKHNVEAARALWRLQGISRDDKLVESTLVTLMVSSSVTEAEETVNLESCRRFMALWTHSQASPSGSHSRRSSLATVKMEVARSDSKSELPMLERPLILLLDALELPKSPSSAYVANWLHSLTTMSPIINTLVSRLASTPLVSSTASPTSILHNAMGEEFQDSTTCQFYLQKLSNVMDSPSPAVWQTLMEPSPGEGASIQEYVVKICMQILDMTTAVNEDGFRPGFGLKQCALSLLSKIFSGPFANVIAELDLATSLLEKLRLSINNGEHSLQISIMDVLLPALKMHAPEIQLPKPAVHDRKTLQNPQSPTLQITTNGSDTYQKSASPTPLPPQLLECLLLGLKSPLCRPVLDSWVAFLNKCLPLYESGIFQILIPLVEGFYSTLDGILTEIQSVFRSFDISPREITEPTAALLLNGLEQTLATAHQHLETEEAGSTPVKTPEQQQTGFFGNMVSGVFANDTTHVRSRTANKRLTVLLCFKDAIKISFRLWMWGDSGKEHSLRDLSAAASFNYITLRLRNRTRRLFEHLFAVEPLECLETMIELWQQDTKDTSSSPAAVLNLLNALENSRPKDTIPAIFDAIYSRTNPNALDPSRKSTLTSDITDAALSGFLVVYARSLEDDAMDEIWVDCSTFLKDVLANPMPHRQTLYRLLEFTAVLGGKVDKTNFGEQRKMRRELGDLFNKLLAATLTIRPMSVPPDSLTQNSEKQATSLVPQRQSLEAHITLGPDDLISILATVAPDTPKILVEPDRIAYTAGIISNQVLLPVFRSKSFPTNVNQRTLDLMNALTSIPEASKATKKDVTEAFNDHRFFSSEFSLVKNGWLPVLRSWVLADKDRLPEILLRLTPPTAAGFLGVGASSARLEADRKAQLNLRRITTLVLAAPNDAFVVHLGAIQEKMIDLLSATTSSSPSTTTRAEVYMLIRSLLLKISTIHLSSFWPTINAELLEALASIYPSAEDSESLTATCILQACKLLDTLLVLGLDDFQMQEWLFISDTTDAVYRPHDLESIALVDDLAESLDAENTGSNVAEHNIPVIDTVSGLRKPLLTQSVTRNVPAHDIVQGLVRPFLRQLSIQAFEGTYGMLAPDLEACEEDLIGDLFDEATLV